MAKYRSGRTPILRGVPRVERPSVELAAARSLQTERDRRAGECLAELLPLLARYRCGLQVVVQDILVPGQVGSERRCAVNVVPLDTPAVPTPAPANASSTSGGAP